MTDVYALQLQPGDVVGGYTLESRLGSGAMGSVWRAVDGGGNAYAMKILRASLSDSDDGNPDSPEYRAQMVARERLRREAVAMRKIRNSGVCQIVDMEIDDSLAFLVTELIEGENLREDVRHNGKYVGDDLERLSSKLIDAVHAVHEAGIVHRDIKTSNVLITWQRLPTLADFGIAVTAYDHSSTGYSLPWAPPETLRTGGAGGEAADIYSLGAVLYASLVGTSPFEYGYHPKTAKELARLIMTQPLPTIQRNDVPTVVHETLAHAMAPNADDRYPSALAFARALQQAQFDLYGHATPVNVEGADPYPSSIARRQITERPPAARQRGKHRKAWMVAGFTVALLTLFLAVFMGFVLPG